VCNWCMAVVLTGVNAAAEPQPRPYFSGGTSARQNTELRTRKDLLPSLDLPLARRYFFPSDPRSSRLFSSTGAMEPEVDQTGLDASSPVHLGTTSAKRNYLEEHADGQDDVEKWTYLRPLPSPQTCFRIQGIPRDWKEADVFRLLDGITTDGPHLALFPAVNSDSQIALLRLPREHDNFLQGHEMRVLLSDGSIVVTIDRHFYGLTPLNKVENNVRAE
jgi:hypothetical protein